jgi:uncharacterized membrane protein
MLNAPVGWLRKGWQDFRRAPWHSLTYGAIFAVVGWMLISFLQIHESYFLLGLFISLVAIGPALAFGLYDVSHELEQNHKPSFSHERSKAIEEMGHVLMLSLLMSVMFMIMLIIISMVMDSVASVEQAVATTALPMSNTTFIVISVVFGGLLFCANSFALPMILDQDANAVTAISTSLNAVWRNKSVFAIWALLILALTAVGFATALIGFVFIVPILGYATWHAYRETINTQGG